MKEPKTPFSAGGEASPARETPTFVVDKERHSVEFLDGKEERFPSDWDTISDDEGHSFDEHRRNHYRMKGAIMKARKLLEEELSDDQPNA